VSTVLQLLRDGIVVGVPYGLMAAGFGLISELRGFFNIAVGALFLVGSVTAYSIAGHWTAQPLAVVGASLAAAVAGAIVLDRTLQTLTRRRAIAPSSRMLITIAVLMIAEELVALGVGHRSLLLPGGAEVGGAGAGSRSLARAALVLGSVVIALVILERTTTLLQGVRAYACDRELALAHGLPQRALLVLSLAGVLAGGAGVLVAYDTGVAHWLGTRYAIIGLAASLLVGTAHPARAVCAGVALGITQHAIAAYWSPDWKDSIALALVIGVLVLRGRERP
jgi:branched-chain amino acid transport system permease protein